MLFNKFPREMGRPFKDGLVWNIDEINNFIKKYGSSYGIYISVYSFSSYHNNKPDYESAIIDKIYLDIDPPNWLNQVRKVFNFCKLKNIMSIYTMSGGGSHIFLFCKSNIQYKRSCIFNFQSYLENELGILIDPQSKGDLTRTFRIPGTFNYKRNRYCIYMDEKLIFNTPENEIYKIAEKYPTYKPGKIVYNNKLVNLNYFDKEEYLYTGKNSTNINGELYTKSELNKFNIPFNKFPNCVRSWIKDPKLGYKGRFCLTVYLRDQQITDIPIPFKIIVSIFKNFLDEDTWLHCATKTKLPNHNIPENLKPIKKAYSNRDYKMYSCVQLQNLGLCPTTCGRWHPIFN